MVQFRANADKLPVLGSPTAVLIDGIEPQSRVGVVHGCVTLGSAALPMLVIIACLGPDGITSPTAENLFPFAIRTLGKVGAVHALRLPENRAGQITGIVHYGMRETASPAGFTLRPQLAAAIQSAFGKAGAETALGVFAGHCHEVVGVELHLVGQITAVAFRSPLLAELFKGDSHGYGLVSVCFTPRG